MQTHFSPARQHDRSGRPRAGRQTHSQSYSVLRNHGVCVVRTCRTLLSRCLRIRYFLSFLCCCCYFCKLCVCACFFLSFFFFRRFRSPRRPCIFAARCMMGCVLGWDDASLTTWHGTTLVGRVTMCLICE